ncbi:MAG: DUF5672 family protein [Usitatibacter sp.]
MQSTHATHRAIVVIISHRATLTSLELISLRQCVGILGRHPMVLVCPEGLDTRWYQDFVPEIPILFVDRRWLSSYAMFAAFKISPYLYERFKEYEYLLFHEPDAFVFSDQLEFWCSQGLDYVGAPWFRGLTEPMSDEIIGVGNGGFSLRKVASHLGIARRFELEQFLFHGYRRHTGDKLGYLRAKVAHLLGMRRSMPRYIGPDYHGHEDFFWCRRVPAQHPWFRIASPREATAFSFEAGPRYLFERNAGRLPFGCHAWFRYDLDFWKPHIEAFGHRIDPGALLPELNNPPAAFRGVQPSYMRP